jgi:hypothetical protein
MSLSLEQLTQVLVKVGISSSLEEEILTVAGSLITPPEVNEESTYEESCIFNKEQLGEQEVEEDNEELHHDLSKTN